MPNKINFAKSAIAGSFFSIKSYCGRFSAGKYILSLATILIVTGIALLVLKDLSNLSVILPGGIACAIGGCLFLSYLISECCNKKNGIKVIQQPKEVETVSPPQAEMDEGEENLTKGEYCNALHSGIGLYILYNNLANERR